MYRNIIKNVQTFTLFTENYNPG